MISTKGELVGLSTITLLLPLGLVIISFVIFLMSKKLKKGNRVLGVMTAAASAVQLVMSVLMMTAPQELYPVDFSFRLNLIFVDLITVDFYIDALSLFFVLLVNMIAFAVTWNAVSSIEVVEDVKSENKKRLIKEPAIFHGLVNLFHFTMLLVPMVNNLVGLWIAIELTTLGSAFLVAYKDDRDSWEAAWKYLVITSTGIILALLGTMFLANAITIPASQLPPNLKTQLPSDQLMNWTYLMELARNGKLNLEFVKLAFLFAVFGYGTKAGLAPMHTWLPDGHGEAPSPISALLSGVLLKSALYAILRFYTLTNTALKSFTFTSGILLGIGLFSLLTAVPFILKENKFKRVLAYHSLEHMGIITFGLGFGGAVALFGVVLHSLNHAVTKSLMFLSFGNVIRQYDKHGIKKQEDITGIFRSMPVTGGILALGALALVGTPPFNIFLSEFIILWGVLKRFWSKDILDIPEFSHPVIIIAVILFMISTTLIFYGLVKHLGKLVLHKVEGDHKMEEKFWRDLFPLVMLFIFVLVLGVWIFPPLSGLIRESVRIILDQH